MRRSVILASLLAALMAPDLAAQTIGTPIFKSPHRAFKKAELAGYISDPGEGISLALQGEYRMAQPTFDWGVTAGFMDPQGRGGNGIFGVGIDARAQLARHTKDFPLDASGTLGFGALFSDGNNGFLIPFGVTLGRQVELQNSKVSFVPYVNPVLAPSFGDRFDGVQFALGLGVDIALSPTFDVRVSGSLGDIEGVGIGLAWHR